VNGSGVGNGIVADSGKSDGLFSWLNTVSVDFCSVVHGF
jgi:hypothetical protein